MPPAGFHRGALVVILAAFLAGVVLLIVLVSCAINQLT